MDEAKPPLLTELGRLINDLEELQYAFHCGVDLVSAISDCFTYTPNNPKSYAAAFTAVCNHLNDLQARFEQLQPQFYDLLQTCKESEE